MKKKIKDGISSLQELRTLIENKNQMNEFNCQIYKIYYMYAAYGYFCQGDFQKAKNEIQKQIILGYDECYTKGIHYNLQICKGIIHFRNNKYN